MTETQALIEARTKLLGIAPVFIRGDPSGQETRGIILDVISSVPQKMYAKYHSRILLQVTVYIRDGKEKATMSKALTLCESIRAALKPPLFSYKVMRPLVLQDGYSYAIDFLV